MFKINYFKIIYYLKDHSNLRNFIFLIYFIITSIFFLYKKNIK